MNNGLVERLLFEEESPTLDFKKEQYRFSKASEDEKAELLKDLLGFANAWRRSEGYILIGVEEVRGGRSNVTGIPAVDHLDDHSLQQFVNRLTNCPVRFHYEAFRFEGKHVGIIRIDQQTRPIYLKRPYGKLEKHQVYIRRGTSTDPTNPALPEEVALMGRMVEPEPAELVIEFAHIEREDSLGTKISFDTEFCEMPPEDDIPDFAPAGYNSLLGTLENPVNRTNPDYYRELAACEWSPQRTRPPLLRGSPAPTVADGSPVAAGRAPHAPHSSDPSCLRPSSRPAWFTQFRIVWPEGSNSLASSSGPRSARTSSTIWRRNSAAYLFPCFDIVDSCLPKD